MSPIQSSDESSLPDPAPAVSIPAAPIPQPPTPDVAKPSLLMAVSAVYTRIANNRALLWSVAAGIGCLVYWGLGHAGAVFSLETRFTVFLYVFYLIGVAIHLGNFRESRARRSSRFFMCGYAGIVLTLLSWIFAKEDYSKAVNAGLRLQGDLFLQSILAIGGVIGAALVVQGIRLRSDSISEGLE